MDYYTNYLAKARHYLDGLSNFDVIHNFRFVHFSPSEMKKSVYYIVFISFISYDIL